ncbi:hypothetical protein DB346_24235 [Verrucomicrobia bacterium LW23]|nr:hypothetical protein DB346_24235 [Verrucomicrobia bacterium LW23]
MPIQILAFAQARDVLGFDEREVEAVASPEAREASSGTGTVADSLPVGHQATAQQVLERLRPGLRAALPPGTRVAIDMEYSDWDAPVRNGQVLAIIPPVSGG